MKIDRLARAPEAANSYRVRLLMLCFLFMLGGALGVLACGGVTQADEAQLQSYILQYAALPADGGSSAASLLRVLLVYFRYPLLVYLSGFLSLGLLVIPVLCVVQGFSLMFSVCCFAAALGQEGVILALAALGVRCFFTLPCMLLLAISSLEQAYGRLKTSGGKGKRQAKSEINRWQPLICVLILLAGVAAELSVVPKLLQLALAGIS